MREGLDEKMTSEQRPGGGGAVEKGALWTSGERDHQAEGRVGVKV